MTAIVPASRALAALRLRSVSHALGWPASDLGPQASRSPAIAARENAYRANNIGVARLEQYDFPAAIAAFRRALEIDPALALARLNLGIALFYGGEPDGARARSSKRRRPRCPIGRSPITSSA